MHDKTTIRIGTRTTRLAAAADGDADFESGGGPWTVSGVAVGEGDILRFDSDAPVLMTAAALEAAAPTQEDEPVSVDHPSNDDGSPVYPPPTDETVGTVTAADYEPGVGVVYEASISDPEIARKIRDGVLEVSVHALAEEGGVDDATGAVIAENIEFRDLSVVSRGDAASNTAEWGPSRALAAWTESHTPATGDGVDAAGSDADTTGLVRQLAARFGITAGATDTETAAEQETETMPAESGAERDSSDSEGSEQMSDTPDDPEHSQPDDPDGDADADATPGVDVDALADELAERFVTVDDLGEAVSEHVEASKQDAKKEELVDDIVAQSDDWTDDDREELLASPMTVLETEHERSTTAQAAQVPGTTGRRSVQAGAGEDEADDWAAPGATARATELDDGGD